MPFENMNSKEGVSHEVCILSKVKVKMAAVLSETLRVCLDGSKYIETHKQESDLPNAL